MQYKNSISYSLIIRSACGRKIVLLISHSQKHNENKGIVISAWTLKRCHYIFVTILQRALNNIRFLIALNQCRVQLIVCLFNIPFLHKSKLKYYLNMIPLNKFLLLGSHVCYPYFAL